LQELHEHRQLSETLPRKLGAFDAGAVVIGGVIGTGIFMVASKMAQQIPSPGLMLLAWLIGGLLSLMGGLTYAELGARFPEAGGQYVYLREIYGPVWGFLYGWVCFLVIQSGSLAAVAVGFATYAGEFVHLGPAGIVVVAIAIIWLLSGANLLSLRFGALIQNLVACAVVLSLVALIAVGLSTKTGSWSHFVPLFPSHTSLFQMGSMIALGVVAVLWSYDGWVCVSYLAGEVRNPNRSLPLAMGFSILVITALYCATNAVYIYVLGVPSMAIHPRVASAAASAAVGANGGLWMAGAILVASFGCINSTMISVPKVYYAMAKDGLFFDIFARIHPKFETPVHAIVLQAAWSSILAISGKYDQLITYVIFQAWVFYAMTAVGLILLRRRNPDTDRLAYRVPGYPVTPILFVIAAVAVLGSTLYNSPTESLAGLAITGCGLPAYVYFRSSRMIIASEVVPEG
jgi:APA family basic amino acid/polyamine antiporter